jgi:hypothetical protein
VFGKQNNTHDLCERRSEMIGARRARLRSRLNYANVVASLALFVALGGTAAAVATLPRDSVGALQIRKDAVRSPEIRKDAVRSPEIERDAVRSPEIKADAIRTSELQDEGVRLRDISASARSVLQTRAAAGGRGIVVPNPDETMIAGESTLTTPTAGSVLAFGAMTVDVRCPAGGGFNCSFVAGLYLDGKPMDSNALDVTIQQGATEEHAIDLIGLAENVRAGTHEVAVGWKAVSPNPASVVRQGDERTAAVFVGG